MEKFPTVAPSRADSDGYFYRLNLESRLHPKSPSRANRWGKLMLWLICVSHGAGWQFRVFALAHVTEPDGSFYLRCVFSVASSPWRRLSVSFRCPAQAC